MPEEWGKIVIQVGEEVAGLFNKKMYSEALVEVASETGIESGTALGLVDGCHQVVVGEGYIQLTYDVAELAVASERFFNEISGREYYARHTDEYGTMTFFSLASDGAKIKLVFDQDGDAMEDDSYRESVTRELTEWIASVPGVVKSQFESFVDFVPEDFIYE